MDKFIKHSGIAIPMDRPNVDTDAIIPKQYLKSIKRTGFGPTLFDDWRYLDAGEPGMDHSKRAVNSEFVLNQAPYDQGSVLLGRENFGCGSSREHAVWALTDFGIRAVIAPSFADIFFNNSFKNGLLPIALPADVVDGLFQQIADTKGLEIDVDLESLKITAGDTVIDFEVDEFRRYCLLNGLDDIGLTLAHKEQIKTFEDKRRAEQPWLF